MTVREKLIAHQENTETILAIAPAAFRKKEIVKECAKHLATKIWNNRITLEEAKDSFAVWCKEYQIFSMLAMIFGEKICLDLNKGILWFKTPEKIHWMPKYA